MTGLRKKQLNINGVIFNIYSNYIDEITEYFNNFIVPCNDKIIATYNIYFDKDENIFNEVFNDFNLKDSIPINTFKNQIHYKDNNKFLIDTKDYICIKNSDNDYKVFAKGKNSIKGLSWIIRELLIRELEDNNYYCMHGTGLEIYDKGILLLGSSGSGKTTLASKINEINTPQKYVSNDRVFIKNGIMHYYPLSIKYTMGTIKNNKGLSNYFITNNILEKQKNINYYDSSFKTKCDIPLTDINKVFPNVENVSKEKIDLIIFPKIDDSLSIKELTDEEKILKLNEYNFTPYDIETKREEWLRFRKLPLQEIEKNKELFNKEIISNIPILEISYPLSLNRDNIEKVLRKL